MLERPRYHENRDHIPINAPLTSECHNFWSDRWISKIHTFSEIGSQDLSRGVKINSIRGLLRVAALKRPQPRKSCCGYKRPQAPSRKKKKKKKPSLILCSTWTISKLFSSLLNTKNTSKPLDSSFFNKKYKVLFLYPTFFPLVLHLGFRGVDVAF